MWFVLTPYDPFAIILDVMSMLQIRTDEVYTTKEAEGFLKISNSTMKRLLKRGFLKANKVGRQYRILGKEILKLVSPELEKQATDSYLKIKEKAVNKMNKW
ncbi:MAG: hypothetical protein A3C72_01770 [Candidatus Taylorbacteria bacterium RIFCSPHIGHO2_02_FULL_43_32b]|uniref:Helix-turn-helix domain-containing protein n=1 Tax=Candidatus Taylorbacteria bacterium RIFCSPHIGHO2_02_FULL_43_32b TaxID=1802306 RepID=A0A1G2ML66_9BACT|nr:MAG: hypothetical protein A3C72_01770 [Candidatus Taylorbacteria bacterium RIFCSPHIGHO2_02_FULL_43_32b]